MLLFSSSMSKTKGIAPSVGGVQVMGALEEWENMVLLLPLLQQGHAHADEGWK